MQSIGKVRANTRYDGVCSEVRAALFVLQIGVVNLLSRVIECAQTVVLGVNDLSSSIEAHGRQRAVRVPKGLLK